MKIASFILSAFAVNAVDTESYTQLESNKSHKKKYPTNKLARFNKIVNQYTMEAHNLPLTSTPDLAKYNLGRKFNRNNKWFNRLSDAFNRVDKNGDHVKCSTYFRPDEEEDRKRRSNGGLVDLMPDEDTENEKCQIAAEEAEEDGIECTDCCEKDADGNWILDIFKSKNRSNEPTEDLARKLRQIIGATKRWEKRFIDECGGKDMRPQRYYNVLKRILKIALRFERITKEEVTALRWKRIFPSKSHKHDDFFVDLEIEGPE